MRKVYTNFAYHKTDSPCRHDYTELTNHKMVVMDVTVGGSRSQHCVVLERERVDGLTQY
jgi:hypothetical protein